MREAILRSNVSTDAEYAFEHFTTVATVVLVSLSSIFFLFKLGDYLISTHL